MELTLFAKVLWFIWVFMFFDLLVDWVDKLPNTRAQLYLNAASSLIAIITVFALALLPFVNLLWK